MLVRQREVHAGEPMRPLRCLLGFHDEDVEVITVPEGAAPEAAILVYVMECHRCGTRWRAWPHGPWRRMG